MFSFYSNPSAKEKVKVFRFDEDTTQDSGFKGYKVSSFEMNCFIKRIDSKEAFKQGIQNTGRDIRGSAYINTFVELFPVGKNEYSDIVKWDDFYWDVSSVLKISTISQFYECYLSLTTDVPDSVTTLENQ